MSFLKTIPTIGIIIGLVWVAPFAYSSLNLSANPADGGNSLRLGRVDDALEVNKAVKIRISTNDGRQYQVYQRLEDSLTNERQTILDSQALKSYAVSASNATGTLYGQLNESVRLTDELIYTSSPDGQSDTFTIVYSVDPKRINASGNFVGRLAYTVRSVGGSQDQIILNIYVEAAAQTKVAVQASSGQGIRLQATNGSLKSDDVSVKISGNVGNIQVSQELTVIPQNELGEELPLSAIQFSTTAAHGETYHPAPEAFSRKNAAVYKSDENEDELRIQYSLADEGVLKAGAYRGKLTLTVESSEGTQQFPFDIEAVVDPVFEMDVRLPEEGVKFGRVLPNEPPQIQEVEVEVRTNRGKPYMVTQSMATSMVTPKGDEIKKDGFTMKMEVKGNSGRVAAGDFVSVPVGDYPIFFSDNKGSPAQFKVYYRLRPPSDVAPGDYTAPIKFSLGEI